MFDHHLQRSIVYKLAQTDSMRFSELKPDVIDNKLFTYHLGKVVSSGYVIKNAQGLYTLTPKGRRLGVRVLESQQALVDHADSVLFLVIRRKLDGAWLLYRRHAHPLIARAGFMHGIPNSFEESVETAKRVCFENTNLDCSFRALGGGYFRVYDKDELESFTHFTLMVCDNAKGELAQNDPLAEYFWELKPDYSSPDMLPNMALLADLYSHNKPFFIERTFYI